MCDYPSIRGLWFYTIPNLQISSTFFYGLLMISGRLQLIPAKKSNGSPCWTISFSFEAALGSQLWGSQHRLVPLDAAPFPHTIQLQHQLVQVPAEKTEPCSQQELMGFRRQCGVLAADTHYTYTRGAPCSHLAHQNIHPTKRDRSPGGILLTFPPRRL